MLVANSFDLWQKDAFFAAAEEVQESADIMESAYRKWVRERREGLTEQALDEVCRELQTALGTAKWQLEEFERAVRLSYRNHSDDFTTARHRQFVAAMANQISRAETTLRESFNEEGKQPLRWVNLDEGECDDLAVFLSGTLLTSQTMKDECAKLGDSTKNSLQGTLCTKNVGDFNIKVAHNEAIPNKKKGFEDVVSSNKGSDYVMEPEAEEIPRTRDDMHCHTVSTSGTRRTWSSPDIGAWKITVLDEDEQKKALMPSNEASPKEKKSNPVFLKQRCGDYRLARQGVFSYTQLRGVNWINQTLGRIRGHQRQQSPQNLQFNCSVQFKLALILTIFLIVPFVLYSA